MECNLIIARDPGPDGGPSPGRADIRRPQYPRLGPHLAGAAPHVLRIVDAPGELPFLRAFLTVRAVHEPETGPIGDQRDESRLVHRHHRLDGASQCGDPVVRARDAKDRMVDAA